MLTKFFAFAAAAAGMLLMASGAQATSLTLACTNNDTNCQNSFKALGNNSGAGSASDSVDWGLFAQSLHQPLNSGTIANAASTTTPNNDSITVKSGDLTQFTTYVEGMGTGPHTVAGPRGPVQVPGTQWDGMFKNGTTVLSTGSTSITLSFGVPLIGLGIDAQIFNSGTYTETLTAYNSTGQLLNTVTQSATSSGVTSGVLSGEGTAPFVGISSNALNNTASLNNLGISYVTISVSCAVTSNCSGGFAIDTALLYHYPISGPTTGPTTTPEPGTMSILGAGLAGLGYIRRRRKA